MLAGYGEEIRRARTAKQLSQEELGKALGVSRQAVNSWERGKTSPGFDRMLEINSELGITPERLGALLYDPLPEMASQTPDIQLFRSVPLEGSDDRFVIKFNGPDLKTERPPALRETDIAQCVTIATNTMMPWRFPGDPVFFHLLNNPRVGDHVLIGFKVDGRRDFVNEYNPFALKLLTDVSSDSLRLKQYFPNKEITVPVQEVAAIYPVIDWVDLYGPFPRYQSRR